MATAWETSRASQKNCPHLADLGVDAVWLSPFYRSPQRDAGYDVSDYCDVDPISAPSRTSTS
jgi:glycosidase